MTTGSDTTINIVWQENPGGFKFVWPRAYFQTDEGLKEAAYVYAEDGRPYEQRYSCRPHLGFKLHIVVAVKTEVGTKISWKKLAATATSMRQARAIVAKVFLRHPQWAK